MAKQTSTGGHRPNPFRGFMDFMSEMNRARSQFLLQHSGEGVSQASTHSRAYVPPTDIFAQAKDLVIRCEVPGVRLDDISVTVTNGVLSISGERHSELDEDMVVYYTRERSYGAFQRNMLLPEGITINNVTATTRNGLLEIIVRDGAIAQTQHVSITDEDPE